MDKEALDRQVEERRAREAREAAELRAYAQSAAHLDGQLCGAAAAEQARRRALAQALDAERRRQAAAQGAREAAQRAAEEAAGRAEQAGALASPWLNEDPALQRSATSPNRRVPHAYLRTP